MLIFDCVSKMTKFYLKRITNSIVKEQVAKNADEERLREHILQNIDYLSDPNRIAEVLSFKTLTRSNRILMFEILKNLLESPETLCAEVKLYEIVNNYENNAIKKSKEINLASVINERDLDLYKTVLEVALEDNAISQDEYSLLEKLREKLKISRLYSRYIEAQLGKFPKNKNVVHDQQEFDYAVKELQQFGILFYCNKDSEENILVVPEEIKMGVKKLLGFEMREECHYLFHDELSKPTLQKISKAFDLPISGKKEDISSRIVNAGCKPSEELNILSTQELYNICSKLKGVAVSGTKNERINRIIGYYDNLNLITPEDTVDERAKYYQYLEKLAKRDNQELLRLKLIKKDIEMENYFEEGTRYLFEKKLGCKLIEFDGTEHADGGVKFADDEVLLWDNKSKESEYNFPNSHYDQFKRYINKSKDRVKVFLIIVPEIGKEAEYRAIKLKQDTRTDTDIALITASDLKYIAENWNKIQKSDEFNLNLFNMTGVLSRKRIELFLKMY